MKRVLQGQEAMLFRRRTGRLVRVATKQPGELHRTINSLRAAIGEEHAVEAGPLRELARQRPLKPVVVEVGKMNRARRFTANHFDDPGVRVAERVDSDSSEKIQILLARRVENVRALAVRHNDRLPLVGGQKKLLGILEARVGLGASSGKFPGLSGWLRFRAFLG